MKEIGCFTWLSMPIFLIAGTMDPVGDYGKGVNEVYKKLKKTGHKNVTMKMYEGARHEILNEINRTEVFADIIEWLDTETAKQKKAIETSVVIESIDEPVIQAEPAEKEKEETPEE